MTRMLITSPEYAIPGYVSPTPEPVLAISHNADQRSQVFAFQLNRQVDISITSFAGISPMYSAGFFGDYYNHVFVIPATLVLVDPTVNAANKFFLWSTFFTDIDVSEIDVLDGTGLTLGFTLGETLHGVKITPETISVGADAPDQELASYTFHFGNGASTRWHVSLVRTNLLTVPPETPVVEVLKWKTDVLTAQDGTEQRIGVQSFQRTTHQNTFLFLENDEFNTIYEQLFAKLNGLFSYPVWTEQTRLVAAVNAGDLTIQINLLEFDLVAGDSLYFDNGNGTTEQAKVGTIAADNLTITLTTGVQNAWDTTAHVYRVTEAKLASKPSYDNSPFSKIDMKVDVIFTDFRDLFSANAEQQEIANETILTDIVSSRTIWTLSGIPIINARPIVDSPLKETFDWNFEVVDFDIGTFDYLTNRANAAVTYDRKFYIKNKDQRFYWNWLLKYMHGQRKPIWLPTWYEDFADTILEVSGNTVTVAGETYLAHYPAGTSNRGIWFAWGGGWFARAITAVTSSGDGNTLITLSTNVPVGFPIDPPYSAGFLILGRQATDEVQREIYPAYTFISTSFIGVKTTPEAP